MENVARRRGYRICSETGFTMFELLAVMGILSILALITIPNFQLWRQSLESKKAAREIVSILRAGRMRAITMNFEHKVEFDSENKRYRLVKGNRANHSNSWNEVIQDWTTVEGNSISMDANIPSIQFNPNGSSNHGSITIVDLSSEQRYKVIISRTGRARIS